MRAAIFGVLTSIFSMIGAFLKWRYDGKRIIAEYIRQENEILGKIKTALSVGNAELVSVLERDLLQLRDKIKAHYSGNINAK